MYSEYDLTMGVRMAYVNDLVGSEGEYYLKCKNHKARAKRPKPKGESCKA